MAKIRRKLEPEVYTSLDDEMNNMIVEILLPGVPQNMIKLKVFNGCLILYARNGDTHYTKFLNFFLPVISKKATAMYGNGLLRVVMPLKFIDDQIVETKHSYKT